MTRTNLSHISFDEPSGILHVTHPEPIRLDSADLIRAYFDDVLEQWQRLTGGRKVYFMVDWTNMLVTMAENSVYAEAVRQVSERAALLIVRYQGDPLQRAAGRLAALKMHRPSHIYGSYQEAEQVIHGVQAGEIALAPR